jgi:cation diffusion facilitator family transporter
MASNALDTGRRIALAGVLGSAALGALNIAVGLWQNSTSVTAAGFEFVGDVLASLAVFTGMTIASRPPDDNHPYGHGRFETLAGLSVGIMLAGGGALISFQSLQGVGRDHAPPGAAGVYTLLISVLVKAALSTTKYRFGRRLRSASLVADAWNDGVDVLSGIAALAALSLTLYDPVRFLAADHYGGAAVGVIVILTGIRVARDASLELMDTSPDSLLLDQIRSVALSVEGIRGVDKCLARKSGLQFHVDLHIEVDPHLTVLAAHELAGTVRTRLRRELSWVADVLVHVEPAEADRTNLRSAPSR